MSYLVLARKYRPRNFTEMVGQEHVVQALTNALTQQRLHHAYLFTGTRGVGKTTVSRILAKSLNCQGPDGNGGITATPCGVCQACTDIDSGRFVDYTELDAASNRGVDEVQSLLEQAVYKPVQGRFKVFMIDEVHMLTNTAFNAMLKTLEEPPEYLKFVLATTDPQKVPATVLSRCLQFNLRPMAPETILEHLQHVLATENVPSETQALRLLARAARGSMRDALSLTDQAISFGSGQLQEAGVRSMLGSVDRSYVFRLIDALARGDGKTVVQTSEVLRMHGLSAASTLEEMTTILQHMAVLQAVPDLAAADDASDPDQGETLRLAQLLPPDETQLLYSLCLHGRGELGLAPDEYAALTMVLLRLLAFKPAGFVPLAPAVPTSAVEKKTEPAAQHVARVVAVETPHAQPIAAVARVVPVVPAAKAPAPWEDAPAPAPVQQVAQAAEPIFEPEFKPNTPVTPASHTPPAIDLLANRAPSVRPSVPPVVQAAAITAPPAQGGLGDVWLQTVNQLNAAQAVLGLTRELAMQSELVSQIDDCWTLRVEQQSLSQPAARDKLQVALQTALQLPALTLQVEAGNVSDSPAKRHASARAQEQDAAVALVNGHPLVQALVRDWAAKIVPGSIKPLIPRTA